jgi:tetratricopeptide (TPR) repeat protein
LKTINVILFLLFPFILLADEVDKVLPFDIHQTCKSSPSQCLVEIDQQLASVPSKSRVWFQYKLYQLDALFQLIKLKELKKELIPWIDKEDVPLRFKVSIYILYGKTIKSEGQETLGNEYLNKAIDTLYSVQEAVPDPMIIVQIANALNELKKYQQGYDMLISLEKKYLKRNNVMFKVELYENLGHFAYRLDKPEEHILFRVMAMGWAKQQTNGQRTAIAVYNLARAYQMTKEYLYSLDYFNQAEQHAKKAKDYHILSMIMYRCSEIHNLLGNKKKAKEYFKLIDIEVNEEISQQDLNILANKIKNNK